MVTDFLFQVNKANFEEYNRLHSERELLEEQLQEKVTRPHSVTSPFFV
jgi:hypothetical protein